MPAELIVILLVSQRASPTRLHRVLVYFAVPLLLFLFSHAVLKNRPSFLLSVQNLLGFSFCSEEINFANSFLYKLCLDNGTNRHFSALREYFYVHLQSKGLTPICYLCYILLFSRQCTFQSSGRSECLVHFHFIG